MPIWIHGRTSWEFQTVHSGVIAPAYPAGAYSGEKPSTQTMWIFPPGFEHGWTAPHGSRAEITVFQFDAIPEPAASFIRKKGILRVAPGPVRLARIARLNEELSAIRAGGDTLALLRFEAACLELTIMALETLSPADTAPLLDRAELVASGAETWFAEHLADAPSVEHLASLMNCSPSHFRRLFISARGIAPNEAFAEIRFSRAKELIRQGNLSVREIAEACGYEDQSCFSRAFRNHEGIPPTGVTSRDGIMPSPDDQDLVG